MGAIQPGTLYVFDNFAPAKQPGSTRNPDPDHGDRVVRAAKNEGFNGPIERESKPERMDVDSSLYAPNMRPDAFEKSLETDMASLQLKTLSQSSGELNKLEAQGVHHSAVNFSAGMSKASLVDQYYNKMSIAWSGSAEPEQKKNDAEVAAANTLLDNFARANGVTKEQLLQGFSNNPNGTEKGIKNALARSAEKATRNNAQIQDAKADYEKAVVGFERNHNSVVVAAENSGDIDPKGKSKDFYDNILSNSHTTTVGAVTADAKSIESYSNPSKNVRIYARGQTPNFSKDGTSYAAPRVAAAMAKAHQMNQQMGSEEIERQVLADLTSKVPGTQASALDSGKTGAYFRN